MRNVISLSDSATVGCLEVCVSETRMLACVIRSQSDRDGILSYVIIQLLEATLVNRVGRFVSSSRPVVSQIRSDLLGLISRCGGGAATPWLKVTKTCYLRQEMGDQWFVRVLV